jgi:pimeloyl-ACP methyl ester carboxylesterase
MSARKAVGDDGQRQSVIKTVHGRGFRFIASVEEHTDRMASPLRADVPRGESTPVRAAPRTRYALGPGGSIAYQVVGDGPIDLVFLPGFVSNVELQWEFPPMAAFFSRLASFARLITFDKRGTGLSERLSGAATLPLEERMDDVRAVMDAASCERATLVGISEGGPMSLLFAATYPQRVERLVLINAFAGSFLDDVTWKVELIGEWWGTGGVYRFLAPSWDRPDDIRFLARYERNSASPSAAMATVAMNAEIDVRPLLPAITAPTLVVHRRHDEVVSIERGREIADGIPHARFLELDGADHLAFVDPGKLLDEIETFVTGAAPATTWRRTLESLLVVSIGDGGGAAVLPDHLATRARAAVDEEEGTVVALAGGTVLAASFDGPARAIRAARQIVARTATAEPPVACGVHTGEVDHRGEVLAGVNVTVACAVADAAAPGEVWVTSTVRDLVAGCELVFEPRGEHRLAGLPAQRQLFAVR